MNPCEGFTDETLFTLCAVLGDTHREGGPAWVAAARWVADHFELPLIEKAAKFGCDPPHGHIEVPAISFVLHARAWARLGVKASPEVANTGGRYAIPVPPDLHEAVEEALQDIDLGD